MARRHIDPDYLHIIMLNLEDGMQIEETLLESLHEVEDLEPYREGVVKMHIAWRKRRGRVVTPEQANRLFDLLYSL